MKEADTTLVHYEEGWRNLAYTYSTVFLLREISALNDCALLHSLYERTQKLRRLHLFRGISRYIIIPALILNRADASINGITSVRMADKYAIQYFPVIINAEDRTIHYQKAIQNQTLSLNTHIQEMVQKSAAFTKPAAT